MDLGKTFEKRELKVVYVKKLLEFGEKYTPKPIILLMSTMRGTYNNALIGALNILHKLLDHGMEDVYPLNNYEFVIFPLVNPDGYEYARQNNTNWKPNLRLWGYYSDEEPITRRNCTGTLIERNFGFHYSVASADDCILRGEGTGNTSFSDSESLAIRKLIEKFESKAIIYISLFGYREAIEYPWAYSRSHLYTLYAFILFAIVLVLGRPQSNRFQHISVIENDAWEQTLPNHLRNPFYKTPRVRHALAKSSWFGPGEMPVFERQAEKISRREIYNVLSHAGLIERRKYF